MNSAFGIAARPVLAALLLTALAACNEPPPAPGAAPPDPMTETATVAADTLAPGLYSWTTSDGNSMPYEVAGEGEATVLLVHCWMCDRTFWARQIPVLSPRYRTIAVDLPGHGEATAEREVWHVADFGQDVAGLIEELDLDNVVLVGHSMGGPVSLRAAAIAGDRVRGVVAVDTLHDAEYEFPAGMIDQMLTAFEADFSGTCSDFVKQMFPEEGVQEVSDEVSAKGCRQERANVGAALMKDFGDIDMETWFRETGVPIRAINAATPFPTRIEANRKYADFDAVMMEGVGHYPHMTRPDEFNPLLLETIEGLL
jgi:pimeloyl-ACP methyl ester carboxylesterase